MPGLGSEPAAQGQTAIVPTISKGSDFRAGSDLCIWQVRHVHAIWEITLAAEVLYGRMFTFIFLLIIWKKHPIL